MYRNTKIHQGLFVTNFKKLISTFSKQTYHIRIFQSSLYITYTHNTLIQSREIHITTWNKQIQHLTIYQIYFSQIHISYTNITKQTKQSYHVINFQQIFQITYTQPITDSIHNKPNRNTRKTILNPQDTNTHTPTPENKHITS